MKKDEIIGLEFDRSTEQHGGLTPSSVAWEGEQEIAH